jgi:predicted nucleic acid-binding protein
MRVLVDTSVWSLCLRRRNPVSSPETEALRQLILEGRAVLIGAIRQEILSGVRHLEQFDRLGRSLEAFPDEILKSSDYVKAAQICNDCLDLGVVTGNTDVLICAVAIDREYEILTTDKDFSNIAKTIPITLYEH